MHDAPATSLDEHVGEELMFEGGSVRTRVSGITDRLVFQSH